MRFCIEQLIREVQSRPCLWDSRLTMYSERAVKKAAWEDLCATFVPEYFESTDAERHGIRSTFQKKWKGMRDAFLRELKKTNPESSGIMFANKRYAYYEDLLFLKPIFDLKPNKTDEDSVNESLTIEYENNADSDNDNEYQGSENKAHSSQATLKRGRPEKGEDRVYSLLEEHIKRRKERDEQNNSDRQFLLSLLPDLQSIDPKLRFCCKFEIMQVIKAYKGKTT